MSARSGGRCLTWTAHLSSVQGSYRAGLRAMILALLVAVPASVVTGTPSPLEGVAERVMEWTPVAVATPLLLYLGLAAKPLALCGAYAVLVLVGGVAGALAPPGLWLGPAVTGISRGVLGLSWLGMSLFVAMPPLAGWPMVLLLVLFVLVEQGGGGWGRLARRAAPAVAGQPRRSPTDIADPRPSRRAALDDTALMVGGAAGLIGVIWLAGPSFRRLRLRIGGGRLFPWHPPAPRAAGFGGVAGLTPEVSSPASFYVMSKNLDDPDLDVGDWSLEVRGTVGRPFRLTAADVIALPRQDQYVTLECVDNPVGGPLMSNALWSGVPLRHLLARAGVRRGARRVVFWATDGHVDSVPLDMATSAHALLAYGMNGVWLPRAHGYPLRALVPGLYGFKNVKWLRAVEVVDHDFLGHWQQRGWTQTAIIQTTARIDVARPLADGRLLVAGVAFAGARGIAGVEVRLGDGPWRAARLNTPALSEMAWVQWQATLSLPLHRGGGGVRVQARATDGRGHRQEEEARPSYPDGPTGIHGVTVAL